MPVSLARTVPVLFLRTGVTSVPLPEVVPVAEADGAAIDIAVGAPDPVPSVPLLVPVAVADGTVSVNEVGAPAPVPSGFPVPAAVAVGTVMDSAVGDPVPVPSVPDPP